MALYFVVKDFACVRLDFINTMWKIKNIPKFFHKNTPNTVGQAVQNAWGSLLVGGKRMAANTACPRKVIPKVFPPFSTAYEQGYPRLMHIGKVDTFPENWG